MRTACHEIFRVVTLLLIAQAVLLSKYGRTHKVTHRLLPPRVMKPLSYWFANETNKKVHYTEPKRTEMIRLAFCLRCKSRVALHLDQNEIKRNVAYVHGPAQCFNSFVAVGFRAITNYLAYHFADVEFKKLNIKS